MTAAAPCPHCAADVHNGATAHPCCEFWAHLTPSKPCPACKESRIARRQQAHRRHGKRERT
jgi:endogenous inhibitor of DNA gyrase (YacG/DUF329 family)